MTDPYTELGVGPTADTAAIRARYLDLVRQFPPDHFAEEFARYRTAYEMIKDLDARVKYHLFDAFGPPNLDAAIALAGAAAPRPRPKLATLLSALPKQK